MSPWHRRIYTATECVCTLSGGACHSQIWQEGLEDTLFMGVYCHLVASSDILEYDGLLAFSDFCAVL